MTNTTKMMTCKKHKGERKRKYFSMPSKISNRGRLNKNLFDLDAVLYFKI
jgi:hypothetical protein